MPDRSQCLKPAAAFDDEESSGEESSGDEALSRAEVRAAAKAAAHQAQARRVEKRAERAACLAVWSEQMSEDEKDVFRWPRSCCPRAQRPNREAGARA